VRTIISQKYAGVLDIAGWFYIYLLYVTVVKLYFLNYFIIVHTRSYDFSAVQSKLMTVTVLLLK